MSQNYGVLRVVRVMPARSSAHGPDARNVQAKYPAGWLPEGLVFRTGERLRLSGCWPSAWPGAAGPPSTPRPAVSELPRVPELSALGTAAAGDCESFGAVVFGRVDAATTSVSVGEGCWLLRLPSR